MKNVKVQGMSEKVARLVLCSIRVWKAKKKTKGKKRRRRRRSTKGYFLAFAKFKEKGESEEFFLRDL